MQCLVANENLLGYVIPQQPTQLCVLSSLVTKGATHFPVDGPYPLLGSVTRPATEADFERFRVCSKGYPVLSAPHGDQ